MKKRLIIAMLSCSLCGGAMAHGGGLDRNRCHMDSANGGSHCHPEEDKVKWGNLLAILGGSLVVIYVIYHYAPHAPEFRATEEEQGIAFRLAEDKELFYGRRNDRLSLQYKVEW